MRSSVHFTLFDDSWAPGKVAQIWRLSARTLSVSVEIVSFRDDLLCERERQFSAYSAEAMIEREA
jgi:hypothetical protein